MSAGACCWMGYLGLTSHVDQRAKHSTLVRHSIIGDTGDVAPPRRSAASRANFSISFGLGMRQLAGRLLISH